MERTQHAGAEVREVSRRICLIWVVAKSLYHASTGDLWLAFYEGWRRFVWACRAASAVFRVWDFGRCSRTSASGLGRRLFEGLAAHDADEGGTEQGGIERSCGRECGG